MENLSPYSKVPEMDDFYHRCLDDTAQEVFPQLEKYLQSPLIDQIPGLRSHLEWFPSKRRSHRLLKPFLVRCGFELAGGKDWRDILPACTASELLNIATYQSNAAFDSKYGIGLDSGHAQFISSAIVREIASQAIHSIEYARPDTVKLQLVELISESITRVYLAQFLDLYVLRMRPSHSQDVNHKEYLELYDLRCRHGSGHLVATCLAIGFRLHSDDDKSFETLFKFGLEYGTGLQIVNDIADYIPPAANLVDTHKRYQDAYSDFRQGKLTLPLYLGLKKADAIQRNRLLSMVGSPVDEESIRWIFSYFNTSGVFADCKRLVIGYENKAKSILRSLPQCHARDLLSRAAATLATNKYFHAVRRHQNVEDKRG